MSKSTNEKYRPGLKYSVTATPRFLEDSFELKAPGKPQAWDEQPPSPKKNGKNLKTINLFLIIIVTSCFTACLLYSVGRHYYDLSKNAGIFKRADEIASRLVVPAFPDQPNNREADDSCVSANSSVLSMLRSEFDNIDIVAHLNIPGTNISYPVVICVDNEFYLNHALDRSLNSAGSLFFDRDCDITGFSGRNYIIYGQDIKNGAMFHDLTRYLDRTYFNEHKDVIIVFDEMITYWEIYAVYTAPSSSHYARTDFASDSELTSLLNYIQLEAAVKSNAFVTAKDKILTLSANRVNTENLIVHAKLVEIIE